MVKEFASLRSAFNLCLLFESICLLTAVWRPSSVAGHAHSDNPMVLLVSFDGFRWDYLNKYNLSNFTALRANGSYADYIYNVFPTATFTNHWSIVTGLYPESHGIILNHMYDPQLNKTFDHLTIGPDVSAWYGQNKGVEPIWTTNQKAGMNRRSAAEWIGANAQFANQAIKTIQYNHSTPFRELVDEFVGMFTTEEGPINFGAIYFDEPDHTGHLYGPDSKEVENKLREVDATVGYLVEQLKSHHLFDKLNLIITSDHGMATVSNLTAIYIDDHLDPQIFSMYGSDVIKTVFLKSSDKLEEAYSSLKKIPNLDVFKQADIPEEFHIKNNPRTGDLLLIARYGYLIVSRTDQINWQYTNGLHGYETNNTAMYPIFLAHGPAFKQGKRIKSFYTVDLYPMMCHILGVQPAPNNGSLINVAEILVHYFNTKLIFYTILSIIPVILASVTAFFLCFLNRKYFDKDRIKTTNTNGYRILANAESTNELDMETVEDEH